MHPLPEFETLRLQCVASVLTVTFNRLRARNAMNQAMLRDVTALFDMLQQDFSVRAVVLCGAGGQFCAGGDMKEMLSGGLQLVDRHGVDPVVAFSRAFGTMLRTVDAAPQVVIAVCEGAVLGGGFGLVCVSDIAMAHTAARFGMPETTRGLPPAQIAPFVVQRVGLTTARRLCLTGAQFDGVEAQRLGVVQAVFTDEIERQACLDGWLQQIRRCAPRANAMTKAIVRSVAQLDMDAVLDLAAERFAEAVRGAEAVEGIQAFLQKRPPSWSQS